MVRSLLAVGEWVTRQPLRAAGARPTDGAAVMTTGGPGRGDGGYADLPTAPNPLGWGAGGPGQHTPTQPLPEVPHAPPSPGMPPAGPRGGRAPKRAAAPRLPRWLRRVLITVLALALVGVLAFATLLLITPSVSTAPSLAEAFARAHGA